MARQKRQQEASTATITLFVGLTLSLSHSISSYIQNWVWLNKRVKGRPIKSNGSSLAWNSRHFIFWTNPTHLSCWSSGRLNSSRSGSVNSGCNNKLAVSRPRADVLGSKAWVKPSCFKKRVCTPTSPSLKGMWSVDDVILLTSWWPRGSFPSHNHKRAGWGCEGHGSRNRRVGSSVYFLNFSLARSSKNYVVSLVRYAQLQQQPQQFYTKIRRLDVDSKRISQFATHFLLRLRGDLEKESEVKARPNLSKKLPVLRRVGNPTSLNPKPRNM